MSGTARPTEAALLLPNRVRDRCEPRLGITTTPVLGVEPLSNPVVEGRPRPLLRGPRVAVLHRVVVDVVRVPLEVILVPDQVLPEAGLEDAALALVLSTRRDRLLGLPPSEPSLGELLLDPSPPKGVAGEGRAVVEAVPLHQLVDEPHVLVHLLGGRHAAGRQADRPGNLGD